MGDRTHQSGPKPVAGGKAKAVSVVVARCPAQGSEASRTVRVTGVWKTPGSSEKKYSAVVRLAVEGKTGGPEGASSLLPGQYLDWASQLRRVVRVPIHLWPQA